jgi:hypothetical protein
MYEKEHVRGFEHWADYEDSNTGQTTEQTLGRVTQTEREQLSDKTNRKIVCRASICTINTLEHDTKLAGANKL